MFLTTNGKFVPPEAMHSAVRFAMRQFMKIYSGFREGQTDFELSSEDKFTLMGIEGSKDADLTIMVNLDKVLCILVQVVQTRISYVEESLANAFTEGDENGDGVLSFQEFLTIVTKVAPRYPRRRILKMFREALQIGDGDSIDRQAFVTVCKRHDLIQLVDLVKLAEGPLKSLVGHVGKKPAKKMSPSKHEEEAEKRKKIAKNAPQIHGLRNKLKALNAFTVKNTAASGSNEGDIQEEQPVVKESPTRLQLMMKALQAQTSTEGLSTNDVERPNQLNLDMGLSKFLVKNCSELRPQLQEEKKEQQQPPPPQQKLQQPLDDEISDEDECTNPLTKADINASLLSTSPTFDYSSLTEAHFDRDERITTILKDNRNSVMSKENTPSSLLSAARGILGSKKV